MTIRFACPACQASYEVADEYAGRTANCKQCGAALTVPPESSALSEPSAWWDAEDEPASSAGIAPANGESASAGPPPFASAAAVGAAETLRGVTENFAYEISQRPDFALVAVRLEQGQKIFAEPSAMATMDPTIELKAGFKGGLGKTLGRALGGESLIINTFTAARGPGEVTFASGALGDAAYYRLDGNTLFLQRGAFMAHSDGVDLTGKWQGAKGFFSGEGLVLLKASGSGDLFFNSYGAILAVDVADEYFVDTGYVVAFEDSLQYRVTVLPGLRTGGKIKSFFFGGEGLVCQFSGQGRIWIQTRHVQAFMSWVHPYRPSKSN